MSEVETFEQTDAGAARTCPLEAGQVKKGGYIMIEGRPCKVSNTKVSKAGKHGHAKVNFVALDIFTKKKYEDMSSSTHTVHVPNITRAEYSLLNIGEDGELSLLNDDGETKHYLDLPPNQELATSIQAKFDDGKQLVLTALEACGIEQIMSSKEETYWTPLVGHSLRNSASAQHTPRRFVTMGFLLCLLKPAEAGCWGRVNVYRLLLAHCVKQLATSNTESTTRGERKPRNADLF
jgi:translation initiation factor 5A